MKESGPDSVTKGFEIPNSLQFILIAFIGGPVSIQLTKSLKTPEGVELTSMTFILKLLFDFEQILGT